MQTSLTLSLALQECKRNFAKQDEMKALEKKRATFLKRSWAQKERHYNRKNERNFNHPNPINLPILCGLGGSKGAE